MALLGQDMRFYTGTSYDTPGWAALDGVDDLDFDNGFATVTFQSRERTYKESKRGQGDPTVTFTLNVNAGTGVELFATNALRNGQSFVGGIGLGAPGAGTIQIFKAHFVCTNFELTGEIDGVAQYSVTCKPDASRNGQADEVPVWTTASV